MEISQISTYYRVLFSVTFEIPGPASLLKTELHCLWFSVNFAKFFRADFFRTPPEDGFWFKIFQSKTVIWIFPYGKEKDGLLYVP